MPRPKKQPVFVPASGIQAIRTRFLEFGFRYNSPAFRLLATSVVRNGSLLYTTTVSEWASSFPVDLSDTWIEAWAAYALSYWKLYPHLCLPAWNKVFFPPWDQGTDTFSCAISGEPISSLAYGFTIGGGVDDEEGMDDRARFRAKMHSQLDSQLDRFFEASIASGLSAETKLPTDLDDKLDVAAAYLFWGATKDQIAKFLNVAPATIYDWLTTSTSILDLPMKSPGHQRAKVWGNPPRSAR